MSETLTRIVDRLEEKRRPSIDTLGDYDVVDETAEEMAAFLARNKGNTFVLCDK